MKCWEIVADNLKKVGSSLGWVAALDVEGRTICIVDPHRDDRKRFIVCADEMLTAFIELESAIRARATQRGDIACCAYGPQDALPEL